MKIGMICFTARGTAICRLLCRRFRDTGTESTGYVPRRFWKPEWEAEGIPASGQVSFGMDRIHV